METLESLHRKINGAGELKSVVRTMKAMSASNISQYEAAVSSLQDYYKAVSLGIIACFNQGEKEYVNEKQSSKNNDEKEICAIVFGSDQGLVGQFNDVLTHFVSESLNKLQGKKEIWSVGERVQFLLSDVGLMSTHFFNVPNSVNAITSLVSEILIKSEKEFENGTTKEFYIFHNQQQEEGGYKPISQRLLPLDDKWKQNFEKLHWPTLKKPEVIGPYEKTMQALIHEYLFVSLYKACAESLATENASRLSAMRRAEKNIEELLDNLSHKYHNLRQSSIDEELFDVVGGFEALKKEMLIN